MASPKVLLCFGFFLAILIIATIRESEAKGSRTSRSSRKTSSRRTISRKRISNSKHKTFHSSVSRSQIQGKKKPFNKRFPPYAAAGLLTYSVVKSPVYGGHYRPYHDSSNIVIPKHRAVRIVNETYKVVARNDQSSCKDGNLTKYEQDKVVNVTTKVSYVKTKESVKVIPPLTTTDPNQTNLTLSANAIKDYIAKIEIQIGFNQSILTNATSNTTDLTNCMVLQYQSYAYVVESLSSSNKVNFVLCQFALFLGIIILSF